MLRYKKTILVKSYIFININLYSRVLQILASEKLLKAIYKKTQCLSSCNLPDHSLTYTALRAATGIREKCYSFQTQRFRIFEDLTVRLNISRGL